MKYQILMWDAVDLGWFRLREDSDLEQLKRDFEVLKLDEVYGKKRMKLVQVLENYRPE